MFKFSIILPCFQVAEYLKRCLDSLFDNGFSDALEVILINDGSTDRFVEVVSEYFSTDCSGDTVELAHENNRVVIVNQTNVGLSDARNRGLDFASGEYVLFIDPDDFVADGYFSCLARELDGRPTDMLLLGYIKQVEDQTGNIVEKTKVFPMKPYMCSTNREIVEEVFPLFFGISSSDLKNGNGSFLPPKEHGGVWRICYRHDFLRLHHLRFDSGLKTNEDRLFNSRCFVYAEKIRTCMEAYYHYTIRKSGLFQSRSGKGMLQNKLYSLKIRSEIIARLVEKGYGMGIDSYAGSNVLSVIELMNNPSESYKDVKLYWKQPEVRASIKAVPYIKNAKFDLPLLMLKCHMPGLLFWLIRIMRKIGIKM